MNWLRLDLLESVCLNPMRFSIPKMISCCLLLKPGENIFASKTPSPADILPYHINGCASWLLEHLTITIYSLNFLRMYLQTYIQDFKSLENRCYFTSSTNNEEFMSKITWLLVVAILALVFLPLSSFSKGVLPTETCFCSEKSHCMCSYTLVKKDTVV